MQIESPQGFIWCCKQASLLGAAGQNYKHKNFPEECWCINKKSFLDTALKVHIRKCNPSNGFHIENFLSIQNRNKNMPDASAHSRTKFMNGQHSAVDSSSYENMVSAGAFPHKCSGSSLPRTIHLNGVDYVPCTVTLQTTAEPPNSKLAFYWHWIIICSLPASQSCIHSKCGVSGERNRGRATEWEGLRACVCVGGVKSD